MKSAFPRSRMADFVVVYSLMLAVSVVLSGCGPTATDAPESGEEAVEESVPVVEEPVGEPAGGLIEGEPALLPAPIPEMPEPEVAETPVEPEPIVEFPPQPEPVVELPPEEGPALVAPTSAEPSDVPASPAISSFAPAEALVESAEDYLDDFEEWVESEEEYNDSFEKIAKHSNTFILVALALGMHDTENEYQQAAPGMVEAAVQLAATSDYASAQAAVAALKEASGGNAGNATELTWSKLATLPELMGAVPLLNSRLKRYLRDEDRYPRYQDDAVVVAAVMAVIAQGSLANSADTILPDESEKWLEFCIEMRDTAAGVVQASDFATATAAMEALNESCHNCHAVFHPEEK